MTGVRGLSALLFISMCIYQVRIRKKVMNVVVSPSCRLPLLPCGR